MSVFTGFPPIDWLREKTLSVLQAAVLLVDLANEPDTTDWYRQKLLDISGHMISTLLPVVGFVHGKEDQAVGQDQWQAILEGGSFALGVWCKRWKIGRGAIASSAVLRVCSEDETREKAEAIAPPVFEGDTEEANDLKIQIYNGMVSRLLFDSPPQAAQRMLLWMMKSLWVSSPPDVVSVSKRFLPTDIGLTPEETAETYRYLHDLGYFERVELSDGDGREDRLTLRLIVRDVNESKYPSDFKEETFGFPGARINGQRTSGQKLIIRQRDVSTKLAWWFREAQSLPDLKDELQSKIGTDKIFVESAEVSLFEDKPRIVIDFRYPLASGRESLEAEVKVLVLSWLDAKVSSH